MNNLFDDNYYSKEETKKPVFEKDEEIDKIETNFNFKTSMEDIISQAKEKYGDNIDPKEFDKYLDEFYQLDYESIVGNTPVRFQYVDVKPFDYGMTTKDILKREDRELNQVISLKRLYPYREDNGQVTKRIYKKFKKRRKN